MKALIYLEDAIDVIKKHYRICDDLLEVISYEDLFEVIEHEIERLPSEPERKTGYWIPQDHNKHTGNISTLVYYCPICSECGYSGNYNMNYCPNCGAKMNEVKEDGR